MLLAGDYTVLGEYLLDLGPRKRPMHEKLDAVETWWAGIFTDINDQGEQTLHTIEGVIPSTWNIHQGKIWGALIAFMHISGYHTGDEDIVMPISWQAHHGYSRKKSQAKKEGRGKQTTKGWAKECCLEYGYTPSMHPGANQGKSITDARDAYLIARYRLDLVLGAGA